MTYLDDLQLKIWADLEQQGTVESGVCPHCGGMGAFTLNVPVHHPAFGKAFKCICARATSVQKLISRLVDELGAIPNDVQDLTFDNFDNKPDTRGAARAAIILASGGTVEGKKGLLLAGPTGTGKTTLAYLIFRERTKQGEACVWTNYTTLIKRVQATYRDGYEGPDGDEIIEMAGKSPFLVIDDLGTQSLAKQASTDRIEIVYRLIDARYVARRPTVITTNLSIEQLYSQFDDRVASRVRSLCHAMFMVGEDLRV